MSFNQLGWGLSLGLHVAILGWLNYAVKFDAPSAGTGGEVQCPSVALVESSNLGDAPPIRPSTGPVSLKQLGELPAPAPAQPLLSFDPIVPVSVVANALSACATVEPFPASPAPAKNSGPPPWRFKAKPASRAELGNRRRCRIERQRRIVAGGVRRNPNGLAESAAGLPAGRTPRGT